MRSQSRWSDDTVSVAATRQPPTTLHSSDTTGAAEASGTSRRASALAEARSQTRSRISLALRCLSRRSSSSADSPRSTATRRSARAACALTRTLREAELHSNATALAGGAALRLAGAERVQRAGPARRGVSARARSTRQTHRPNSTATLMHALRSSSASGALSSSPSAASASRRWPQRNSRRQRSRRVAKSGTGALGSASACCRAASASAARSTSPSATASMRSVRARLAARSGFSFVADADASTVSDSASQCTAWA
jgi:hypothetical protein